MNFASQRCCALFLASSAVVLAAGLVLASAPGVAIGATLTRATVRDEGEQKLTEAINRVLNNPQIQVSVARIAENKYAVLLEGTLAAQAEIDSALTLIRAMQPAPVVAVNSQLKLQRQAPADDDRRLEQTLKDLLNAEGSETIKVKAARIDEDRYAVRLSGMLQKQEEVDAVLATLAPLRPSPIATLNTIELKAAQTPKPAPVETIERWRINFLPLRVKSLDPTEPKTDRAANGDNIDRLVQAINRIYGTQNKPAVERANLSELLLRGGPETRLKVKRLLAVVDVPWPQVQTNMWAIQVSGDKRAVGEKAAQIQYYINGTRGVVAEVLGMLNRIINANASRFTDTKTDEGELLNNMKALGFDASPDGPLSLNDALIYLALDPARRGDAKYKKTLTEQLADAIAAHPHFVLNRETIVNERKRLGIWDKNRSTDSYMPFGQLRKTFAPFGEASDKNKATNADVVGIKRFVQTFKYFRDNNDANDPEHQRAPERLAVASAMTDRLLKQAVDAFSADMEEMFFLPLLRRCQSLSSGTGGVSLVGQTRLVVTSNIESRIAPDMSSYVETTRPRPFGQDLLDLAFPQSRTSEDKRESSTSTSSSEKTEGGETMTTGPEVKSTSARSTSDTRATSGLTGAKMLLSTLAPAEALALGAVLMSEVEPTFAKVAPGIAVHIRPMVMPDAGAARMVVEAQFGVKTAAIGDPTKRTDVWTYPMPTAVESHRISTDAAVSAFDLFDLSHFSVTTSTPQPPWHVPVLGRLPIFGPMFQRPRGPKDVHYESIILVNSVILPRSLELARFYAGN